MTSWDQAQKLYSTSQIRLFIVSIHIFISKLFMRLKASANFHALLQQTTYKFWFVHTHKLSFLTNFTNFVIYMLSGEIPVLWQILFLGSTDNSPFCRTYETCESFILVLFHLSFLCLALSSSDHMRTYEKMIIRIFC